MISNANQKTVPLKNVTKTTSVFVGAIKTVLMINSVTEFEAALTVQMMMIALNPVISSV